MNFAVLRDNRTKIKIKKRQERQVHRPCQRTKKKLWNVKVTVMPIIIGRFESPPKLCTEAGRVKNEKASRGHPNYSIVKIGQNIEKKPGDLKRLVFIRTPVKALSV